MAFDECVHVCNWKCTYVHVRVHTCKPQTLSTLINPSAYFRHKTSPCITSRLGSELHFNALQRPLHRSSHHQHSPANLISPTVCLSCRCRIAQSKLITFCPHSFNVKRSQTSHSLRQWLHWLDFSVWTDAKAAHASGVPMSVPVSARASRCSIWQQSKSLTP
jgi:hypothetical protein